MLLAFPPTLPLARRPVPLVAPLAPRRLDRGLDERIHRQRHPVVRRARARGDRVLFLFLGCRLPVVLRVRVRGDL